MTEPADGRRALALPGFTYEPQFISKVESESLIAYFASLRPLWEQRHRSGAAERTAEHSRRLTRPVYWLGAWQFACLGYYAEPLHREHRCVRGEPFPSVIRDVLRRLRLRLRDEHGAQDQTLSQALPNTCLLNYYGREVGQGVPRDCARLRMHRDNEPGPVVMFNIGQPGLIEFLDPKLSPTPELRLWMRHRSISIISGADFKDRLYHRVSKVRTGDLPRMHCQVPNFELRRVSISFRYVPEAWIEDFSELPGESREQVRDYMESLAETSEHYRAQLRSPHY